METMQHKQVPAWLNLDAIIPPDIRTDIEDLTPACRELAAAVTNLVRLIIALKAKYEDAGESAGIGAIDELSQYLDTACGWDGIRDALAVVNGASAAIIGGGVTDGFYRECASRLGQDAFIWLDYIGDREAAGSLFTVYEAPETA